MASSNVPRAALCRLAGALLLAAALWALPAAPGAAQQATAGGPAATVSTADLEALTATLEDEAARKAFVARLRALIAARQQAAAPAEVETTSGDLLASLSERVRNASGQVLGALTIALDVPRAVRWLGSRIGDPAFRLRLIDQFLRLAVVILLALAGERLARVLLRGPRRAVEERENDTSAVRALFLVARTFLDIVPIAAFAAVAYGTMPLAEPARATRLILIAFVNASVLARAIGAVARMTLAPRVRSLRLLPIDDEGANYAFIWLRRLTVVGVYGYILSGLAPLLGLPYGTDLVLLNIVGIVFAVMLIVLVLQNRAAIASRLRGRPGADGARHGLAGFRGRLAEIWHVLAIIYIVGIYGVWALRIEGGFDFVLRATLLTVVVLLAANLTTYAGRRLAARGFAVPAELRRQVPTLQARANRYVHLFQWILRVLVYLVATLAILQAWGIDAAGWLATEGGRQAVASLLTIALILTLAAALWEGTSWLVEYYLARADEDDDNPGRRTRLLTFLPLVRRVVTVVLLVLVLLTVLSELGIDIAPLLAGAGVLGLAVGFGAQTLVKDVITGMFILLEDTIAVGDVVTVGGQTGVVESVSIRTIRLRDLSGTVYTVPFSDVSTVINLTKDFSYAVMEVGIAYREDVDAVIEVLRQIGAEMQADETYGPAMLEPLEVLGLDQFGDSAVVVKVRIKTPPIKQWMIRREFNRRMKQRFDELGIEIPFPHTTIYFGVDKDGNAPPAQVALAPEAASATEKPAAARPAAAPPPRKSPPAPEGSALLPDKGEAEVD